MAKRKVFCLGFTKTGKTSLDNALRRMGYTVLHYPKPDVVMLAATKFDALSDITVIPYMEKLDKKYPTALFILTVRNVEDWLDIMPMHMKKHGKLTSTAKRMRMEILGTIGYDRGLFRKKWIQHVTRVKRYFKGRKNKLLVMNICAGDGYPVLCKALGRPVIKEPFPHGHKMLVPKKALARRKKREQKSK